MKHPRLNRSIQSAQKKVEQHNFQIRKRTLEYDDVMNKQREVIYGFRNDIINGEDVRDRLMDIMEEVVVEKVVRIYEQRTGASRLENPAPGRLGEFEFSARHAGGGNHQSGRVRARTRRWPARCSTG